MTTQPGNAHTSEDDGDNVDELAEFLTQLFEQGSVRVKPPDPAAGEPPRGGCRSILASNERIVRRDFPGVPPPLNLDCAAWAAAMFHRACQAAVYRELSAEAVADGLAEPCPAADDEASRHYSVDLVFQYLPDLLKLVVGVAPNDPLILQLRRWAEQWPLSSVGLASVGLSHSGECSGELSELATEKVSGIVDHPALRQHYVDRIIARRDASRLQVPAIREAVRQSLGAFADEFPGLPGS